MNDPRQFLLGEMAQAQNLNAFMLACAALTRYEQLLTASTAMMGQHGAPPPMPPIQPPFVGDPRINQQRPNGPGPGPQPYRPNHEPSWGEDDDRMPWEGQ